MQIATTRMEWTQAISYAFILLLITASSCSDKDMDDEIMDLQEQIDIADDMIDLYGNMLLENTEDESRAMLVEALLESNDITSAGVSADNSTVWWKYRDGLEYSFFTETALTLDTTIEFGGRPNTPMRSSSGINDVVIPENKDALILSPYFYEYDFESLQDETAQLETLLTDNSYNVTYKRNTDYTLGGISLDDYRRFDDFSVICISTHGGLSSDKRVVINSGVLFTEELQNAMREDIDNKIVGIGSSYSWLPWRKKHTVTLSSSWFGREYPDKLDQTLIHLGSCNGLDNNTLADALVGNESAFYGWIGKPGQANNRRNAIGLFGYLMEGYTVKEAYDQVVADGTDIQYDEFGDVIATFDLYANSFDSLALADSDPCADTEIFKSIYIDCSESPDFRWTVTLDYVGSNLAPGNPSVKLEFATVGSGGWANSFPDSYITVDYVDVGENGGTVEILFRSPFGSKRCTSSSTHPNLNTWHNWDFRVSLGSCGVWSDYIIFNLEFYGP